MLKLQHKGADKSIWLVGPVMKIGSGKTCDLVVTGTGIEEHHVSLHVSDKELLLEAMPGCAVYLNEKQVTGKVPFTVGDVIRIVAHEFTIIDSKSKSAEAPAAAAKPVVSAEETVFRGIPVAETPSVGQGSGWMLQGLHKSLQNKRYPLEGTMTLGRSPDCELHFSYERLSRKHAEFKLYDGVLWVTDLDSSNGTFRNGEKIQKAKLVNGDTIAFDKLEFTVIAPAAASDSLASGNAMNQTVMRAAITPEVMKQAKANERPAAPAAAPQAAKKASNSVGLIVAAAAIVVLAVIGFVFFA